MTTNRYRPPSDNPYEEAGYGYTPERIAAELAALDETTYDDEHEDETTDHEH